MTENFDEKPLASDEQHHLTQNARATLQDVVNDLVTTLGQDGGHDPEVVAEQLRQAIDAAGLPEQPAPWVRSTADELADGRIVVMDPTTSPSDEELDALPQTAGEHQSPKLI